MVKPSIVAREFTHEEIQCILSALIPPTTGPWSLDSFHYLFGGLSTTTVRVNVRFDRIEAQSMVLKIFYPNPGPVAVFQNAINVMTCLAKKGKDLPIPCPLFSEVITAVQLPCGLSLPCLLVQYIPDSVAADVAVERMGADRGRIMEAIGKALGSIHNVTVDNSLMSYKEGGAVDLIMHLNGQMLEAVRRKGDPEFTKMYQDEMKCFDVIKALPVGIIHGDPFMDNFLVNSQSFELTAIVDFEDACTGPVLFDLASAIAGSCFMESSTQFEYELDFTLIDRLLWGYRQTRELTRVEVQALAMTVRIALLCNCTFRFLTHSSNTYRDLFQKILYMGTNETSVSERLSRS